MEKFLLIIREDLEKMRGETLDQRLANIPAMMGWVESLAETGNYILGEALHPDGRYVRKDDVLSDGPFIEAKEGVSGITFFNAENLEQAVAIAQSCPLVMQGIAAVEVRPVLSIPS